MCHPAVQRSARHFPGVNGADAGVHVYTQPNTHAGVGGLRILFLRSQREVVLDISRAHPETGAIWERKGLQPEVLEPDVIC